MKRPSSANQGPKKIYISSQSKNSAQKYLPNIPSLKNNYLKEDAYEEELYLLQVSWNELGITPEYRTVFINILEEATEAERNSIFAQEKNNLKRFKDAILNLKKEIDNRDNNISQLKKFNFMIQNTINNGENANSINSILQNVISLIKNLRINAVNIVKKIIKVNQITAYYASSGKFNVNKIKPEYAYDSKYLFKMKSDLLFLKNSALSTFIEMNNTEIDPFLTNCAPPPNRLKGKKIIIPISDDMMKLIKESRYALLQETVLHSIEKENNINMKSSDFYEMDLLSKNNRNNLLKRMEEEKFRLSQNKLKNYNSSLKMKNNFYRPKNQSMSRYIHNLKNTEHTRYNNLFYKKKNSPFSNRKKLSTNNSNRIVIMHEEIQSLSNEQFMKRLGNIENLENDNMMKNAANQILSENLEKLQDENAELRNNIKKLEEKLREYEEKKELFEQKNNEIAKKVKESQNELEQLTQKKKKKENELNNKIDLLQKEIQNIKNENTKTGDNMSEQIKNLEDKLKNEENTRKEKEKEIENMENKLKEKNEEKEKINQELQEQIKLYNILNEEKVKLEEEKNEIEKIKIYMNKIIKK